MKYKHLTQEERYHIQAYKKAGYSQKNIANKRSVLSSFKIINSAELN